jgi:hypothetical protein
MDEHATDAEALLLEAARSGHQNSRAVADGKQPTLRASVLMDFLHKPTDGNRLALISGARITDPLNLTFADVTAPLTFEACTFDSPPDISWARLRFLSFSRCRLPALTARNTIVDGDLVLSDAQAFGGLDLSGVKVSGNLLLDNARLQAEGGRTLVADNAVIGGSLSAKAARIHGSVHLFHVRCDGAVTLDDASIDAPGAVAVAADSIDVGGGYFSRGCSINGEICMRHAKINHAMTFTGSTLRNADAVALRLDRSTLGGGLFLGFGAAVEVRSEPSVPRSAAP